MEASRALRPVSRDTVVDTVTRQLRTEILSGALAPGTKLPAERQMAERLGINRLTLRAALSRLEAHGLIATQHGARSVIRNYREHGGVEMLPELIHVTRRDDRATYIALFRDVLDLRRTVAAEAVALAAERHDARDLEAIRTAMAAQAARVSNVLAFARGDLEVARLVARAARNIGLELLLNTIVRFPLEDPALARAMYPSPRTQYQHYAALLSLLESRNGALAREAMRGALEAIDKATLARLDRTRSHAKRKAAR